MNFLTDFADQAVLLPLAAGIALVLALSGWGRGLAAYVVCVVAMLGVMALLKYLFNACPGVLSGTGVHSPSGHTAASTVVMGGALVIFLRGRVPGLLLAAAPPVIAVVFGASRIAVGAHNLPEVLAGGAVGLAVVAVMAVLAGRRPTGALWPAALVGLGILLALHGVRLHAERAIHDFPLFTWLPLPTACHA